MDLPDFFEHNQIRVGEGKDFKVNPPLYYSSLRDGFYNYFQTFRFKRLYFSEIFYRKEITSKELAYDYTGSDDGIVFAILSFHRFFELLIKDVLREVNPLLAVKLTEKTEHIFDLLESKEINADKIKTVEYDEAFKRLRLALEYYSSRNIEVFNKISHYEVLTAKDSPLQYLTMWRNRIMHNGSSFPNVLAFEFLISQLIIPLVEKIVRLQNKKFLPFTAPHYFHSPSGLDIVGEILKLRFTTLDLVKPTKPQEISTSFLKLQHLKELGRASYNQDFYKRKGKLYYEHLYEGADKRAVRFAKAEKKSKKNVYEIRECICCGVKSLIIYRQEYTDLFSKKIEFNTWATCFYCDYLMQGAMGDPYDFGLSSTRLFPVQ